MGYLVLVYGDAMIIINHTQTGIRLDCECSIANSHQCTGNDEMCYRSTNYLTGKDEPNYPVPAIRALFTIAQSLIQFGEITAENSLDLQTVFERYVKLR